MKHLSIATKLALTIGIAVGAGAIMVAVLLGELDAVARTQAALLAGEVHQTDAARVIQVEFKKQMQEWKNVLLRGRKADDLRKHATAFHAADEAVRQRTAELLRAIADPALRERLSAFEAKHREMSESFGAALTTFAASEAKDPAAGDKLVRGTGRDRAAMELIDALIGDFNERIETQTRRQAERVAERRKVIVACALLVLVLVLGVSIAIARDVVGAQRGIVAGLRAIAAGDLDARLDDRRRDEMGKIVVALNAAIESWRRSDRDKANAVLAEQRLQTEALRAGFEKIAAAVRTAEAGDLTTTLDLRGEPRLIAEVGELLGRFIASLRGRMVELDDQASQLAAAAEELSITAREMSAASQQTAVETAGARTTVGQMGHGVESVSTSAAQMSQAIEDIAANAGRARKVASDAVAVVDDADRTIARLGASSEEIGDVVKVITSIAAQTNLLALNATIEAARAGIAGRGFAIVAREVKELAAETTKATEGIGNRVRAIQGDAAHAVGSIAKVKAAIDEVNGSSATIAAAVEEHTSVTSEVGRHLAAVAEGAARVSGNVDRVAGAADATARGAANTQSAAELIAKMAEQVRALVGQFRLADGNQPAGNKRWSVETSTSVANGFGRKASIGNSGGSTSVGL